MSQYRESAGAGAFDAHALSILEVITREGFTDHARELNANLKRYAHTTQNDDLLYEVMLLDIRFAQELGDTETMLDAFNRCIQMHDSDPRRYPHETPRSSLLACYKWVACGIAKDPSIARVTIEATLDDMQQRFAHIGASQHGVLHARLETALVMGDYELAEHYRQQRLTTKADRYSHCQTCIRSDDAALHYQLGKPQAGLELLETILHEPHTCHAEPQRSQSHALLPLLRTGRNADAKAMHISGCLLAQDTNIPFEQIAGHLLFCAVTGNESRGLSLLENQLRNLGNDSKNGYSHMKQLTATAVLLDAITRAGHGAEHVHGSESEHVRTLLGGEPDHGIHPPLNVEAFAQLAWSAAERLARQFDARNGNNAQHQAINAARALAHEHYEVSLQPDMIQLETIPQHTPQTAADYLNRAVLMLNSNDPAGASEAAAAALRFPIDACRPNVLDLHVELHHQLGDDATATDYLQQLTAELRACGRMGEAARIERWGLDAYRPATQEWHEQLETELSEAKLNGTDQADYCWLLLKTATAALHCVDGITIERLLLAKDHLIEALTTTVVEDPYDRRFSIELLLACCEQHLGNTDEGREQYLRLLDTAPSPSIQARALMLLAQNSLNRREIDAGVAFSEQLMELQHKHGNDHGVIEAALMAAFNLNLGGRDSGAVIYMRLAMDVAAQSSYKHWGFLHFTQARYLINIKEFTQALEQLEQAYSCGLNEDAPTFFIADVLYFTGYAAMRTNQYGLANESWHTAIDLAEQTENYDHAARTGSEWGVMLADIEHENERSLEIFQHAVENANRSGDPAIIAVTLRRYAQCCVAFNPQTALDVIEQGLSAAEEADDAWLRAEFTDLKARALGILGHRTEALSLALTAADQYTLAGDPENAALSDLLVARMLNEDGQLNEAGTFYNSARERVPQHTPIWKEITREYADSAEALGQDELAQQLRNDADLDDE